MYRVKPSSPSKIKKNEKGRGLTLVPSQKNLGFCRLPVSPLSREGEAATGDDQRRLLEWESSNWRWWEVIYAIEALEALISDVLPRVKPPSLFFFYRNEELISYLHTLSSFFGTDYAQLVEVVQS